MNVQAVTDFNRIAEAVDYIKNNFSTQPSLDNIAAHVHVSPTHFQKLFTEWAGVSPKKFLQYVTINYAKKALINEELNLFNTAEKVGLSGTGRLHDLFVNIEGMTPGEYKNGGKSLQITYSFSETNFGRILIASTQVGICHVAFIDDETIGLQKLISIFPNANFIKGDEGIHQNLLNFFTYPSMPNSKINLHLKGTTFQLKVWEALLKIPVGKLSAYGKIASQINNPKAARAVGSAIGDNPIAYIIPCHRVIQASGILGGYIWGSKRKAAIIGWEAAKVYSCLDD